MKAFHRLPVVLLGALLFVTAGCSTSQSGAQPTATPNKGVIDLGVILPLSGNPLLDADGLLKSVQLAVAQANANAVIPGYSITVTQEDDAGAGPDGTSVGATLSALQTIQSDPNAAALIGPLGGNALSVVSQHDSKFPTLAIGPSLAGNRSMVQLSAGWTAEGADDAATAVRLLSVKTYVALDDGSLDGASLLAGFQPSAKANNLRAVHPPIVISATTIPTVIQQLLSLKPNLVYYAGDLLTGVELLKQSLPLHQGRLQLMAAHTMRASSILYPNAAGGPADPWIMSYPGPDWPYVTAAQPYTIVFQQQYNRDPPDLGYYAYEDATLVIRAIAAVVAAGATPDQPTFRAAVQGQLLGMTAYSGVTGPISLLSGRALNQPITFWKGAQQEFLPFPAPTAHP